MAEHVGRQNWTLDVIARDDGWVELALAVAERDDADTRRWIGFREPFPWIIGDEFGSSKPRGPVWTRALFTPAEVRVATHFADSVLDGTITAGEMLRRSPGVAPKIFLRKSGMPPWPDHPIFSWYMFDPEESFEHVRTVEFGISTCLGLVAPPELLGRGVKRTVNEYRAMLRLLDSAADRAASKRLMSRPQSPETVTASQAGCTAIPLRDQPRPAYPADGQGKEGDVRLDAVIDTSGKVESESIRIVQSDGRAFDTAAVIGIRSLRFSAALLTTATPLRQRVRIQVHFSTWELTRREIDNLAALAAQEGAEILILSKVGKPRVVGVLGPRPRR